MSTDPYPGPPTPTPGHPPPEQPVPCVNVVKVPVPSGTVNLLDPEVIAKMVERGEAQNAAEGR